MNPWTIIGVIQFFALLAGLFFWWLGLTKTNRFIRDIGVLVIVLTFLSLLPVYLRGQIFFLIQVLVFILGLIIWLVAHNKVQRLKGSFNAFQENPPQEYVYFQWVRRFAVIAIALDILSI